LIAISFALLFLIALFVLGDLILSVNNQPLHGVTHQEAINVFKGIKNGLVEMIVGRSSIKAQS